MSNPYTNYHFKFPASGDVPGGKVMVNVKGENCTEEDAKMVLMQMQTQYADYCKKSWENGNECRFFTHVVQGTANCRKSNLTVCKNRQKPELVSMVKTNSLIIDEVIHLDMPIGEKQNYLRMDFD